MENLKIYGRVHTSSIQLEVTMHFFYKSWMEQSYLEVQSMAGCLSISFVEIPSLKLHSLYITLLDESSGKKKIQKQRKEEKEGRFKEEVQPHTKKEYF